MRLAEKRHTPRHGVQDRRLSFRGLHLAHQRPHSRWRYQAGQKGVQELPQAHERRCAFGHNRAGKRGVLRLHRACGGHNPQQDKEDIGRRVFQMFRAQKHKAPRGA